VSLLKILGVNTQYYPMQGELCGDAKHTPSHLDDFDGDSWCDNPPPTVAVLVEGDIGDYACYVGHGTPEWVARHGKKIGFKEACCHFSGGQLEKARYRI